MDVLSKNTEDLIKNPQVREAVHSLLDPKPGQDLTVLLEVDGQQVQLTRVPSTSTSK